MPVGTLNAELSTLNAEVELRHGDLRALGPQTVT